MALKYSIDFFTTFLNVNTDDSVQQKWSEELSKFKKSFKKADNKASKVNKGPKKNQSAYNIYCSQNMSVLKEELPDLDNKAIFSEMAKRWKKVKKSNDFDKYQKLATADKERYVKEKEDMGPETKKAVGPKKPKTAYMMFCDEERKKIDNIKGKELLVELGARWQVLKTSKDKRLQKYEKLAEADKQRYKNEKENFVDVVVEVPKVEESVPEVEPEPEVVVEKPKKTAKKAVKKVDKK